MGDRYYYDKSGNYKGMTSDRPPGNGNDDIWGWICVIVFVLFVLGSCGSKQMEVEPDAGINSVTSLRDSTP